MRENASSFAATSAATALGDASEYSPAEQWLAVRAAVLCRILGGPGRFHLAVLPEDHAP